MNIEALKKDDGLNDREKSDFVTLTDFCKRYNLNYELAKARKKMGWSPDEIKEGMTHKESLMKFA